MGLFSEYIEAKIKWVDMLYSRREHMNRARFICDDNPEKTLALIPESVTSDIIAVKELIDLNYFSNGIREPLHWQSTTIDYSASHPNYVKLDYTLNTANPERLIGFLQELLTTEFKPIDKDDAVAKNDYEITTLVEGERDVLSGTPEGFSDQSSMKPQALEVLLTQILVGEIDSMSIRHPGVSVSFQYIAGDEAYHHLEVSVYRNCENAWERFSQVVDDHLVDQEISENAPKVFSIRLKPGLRPYGIEKT